MVSVGSKGLSLRRHKSVDVSGSLMYEENKSSSQILNGRKLRRKGVKKASGQHGDAFTKNQTGDRMARKGFKRTSGIDGDAVRENQSAKKARVFSKENEPSVHLASSIRKPVDPETSKYFTEIANVIEGSEVDLEERSIICGNALEEARGKEVELSTDYIISHTMQILLEGCSVHSLCFFLRSCSKNFPHISMDKSGSHVAETALKSLARYLEDEENYTLIKDTLFGLCQAIVVDLPDIMCNSYGSHVLRRLLCLCKGVDVSSTESAVVLAERLNLRSSRADAHVVPQNQAFPELLELLKTEMLNPAKVDIEALLISQYGSLVLQTVLKLLDGQEEELFLVIPILLGWPANYEKGMPIAVGVKKKILSLVEESAYSHLMEVILSVAPDNLYGQILAEVFSGSLFRMSSSLSANFVVQSLVSHARKPEHIKLIYDELGSKLYNLLELGRAGVVASLVSACQKLHFHEHTCAQALANSVRLENEPSSWIIPRLLFLDHYFSSYDKDNWTWPSGKKMHILGSLILQTVFKFPTESIQAFITSMVSLEDDHALEVSKDPAGTRVVEAFLSSNASAKLKRRLITKLKGHFGDLSLLPSGSFTVEKCFNSSNLSLREAIVSELLPVQAQLSKTKQGPYLLKHLDVEGYLRKPDLWRSMQTTKHSAFKDFYATFGAKNGGPSSRVEGFLADAPVKPRRENVKDMRKEIETRFSSASSGTPFLAHQSSSKGRKPDRKRAEGFDGNGGRSKKMKM